MDNTNMTEEQLNRLVDKLADAMVKRIYGVEQREARKDMTYYAERADDNAVGELARLMTLLNLYEEREEYEKCHAVKKHLDKVNKIVENL
jgi:5'-deoxynucleotidase YfbR-like HD superfamily hydrolase